ncbi:cobalamin B12-binding domain-containing protein [Candidatus Woesearchaeota archaeon]|nr:cobalamin B12-binding domain-containing protein [Candidatus Woesearchaeota archaeon]
MNISLVFPRMKYKTGDPPLGMALIAASLRKNNFNVEIIDTTFNPSLDYVRERLIKFNPSWVAIYSDTMMYNDCIEISKMAKEMAKKVVIGGPHATLKPDTLVDYADYLVMGEAEETIIDVIKGKFAGTKIVQGVAADIENLPIAAYDLLDMKTYVKKWHLLDSVSPNLKGTSIFSARGCSFRCTFCQPVLDKLFGRKFRTRSVESVINELKYLKEEAGLQAFFFQDDTFTLKKIWIRQFCKKMVEEKLGLLWGCNSRIDLIDEEIMTIMYQAGLRVMHIGLESGSQRVLDEIYHKDIKLEGIREKIVLAEEIGIHCLCFFMLGAPGETKEEIEKTIKFAVSLNATEITATIATPLPGTYLYDAIKDKYKITDDFSKFDYYKNLAYENPDISFKELKWLQKKLLLKFYTHPKRWSYIGKHLVSFSGYEKMFKKIMRFV